MKNIALFLLAVLLPAVGISAKTPAVRSDVKNRAFYKDVFFDCGIGLTTRDTLPAVKMLGLSTERVAFSSSEDADFQNAIIAGDTTDWNGSLLYPDGEPRFAMIFIDGGSSLTHGSSLGARGREAIRTFVNAGGSYVGTCAGAIIASEGHPGNKHCPTYLGLWPSWLDHSGKADIRTGMTIEPNSPLLRYYDFGGDKYVADVRHNMGNFPKDMPAGTEVLARYDGKSIGKMNGKPSVEAYKKDAYTGRLVLCGSHPEEVTEGERRDLTAAMIRYALDGVGVAKVKGFLNNGEERVMDRYTFERKPEYTRIGDMQCHHFAVDIPKGAKDVTFTLQGAEDSHMTLAVCHDTFAFDDCADFRSTVPGAFQQFVLAKPQAGVWYVCVRCLDTPVAHDTATGHVYSRTVPADLLNGVPYSVKVTWK